MSGSCLSASHAYSSITVSPWKVRALGIFLASGGSIVMRAQSNDEMPGGIWRRFGTMEPGEDIGEPDRVGGRLLGHRHRH